MSVYNTADLEALRTHNLLKQWTAESLLTADQQAQLEPEPASQLRTTNVFLRVVLFAFTTLIVAAGAGLMAVMFDFKEANDFGGFCIILAIITYAAAEFAVHEYHLYHHGIEEALAASSIACFFTGVELSTSSGNPTAFAFILGALASLWVWYRFSLSYAFVAAMIFTALIPSASDSSQAWKHKVVAGLYTLALIAIMQLRPRDRATHREQTFSLAEAFLWLGLYLSLNLMIFPVLASIHTTFFRDLQSPPDVSRPFYWLTFALAWLLPPVILARALRHKDRYILAAGILTTLFTFLTNKPYLGMQRHPWDPMILGVVLIAVSLYLRRWLAQAPDGIRHGYTAARLSAANEHWLTTATTTVGLVLPQTYNPNLPPTHQPTLSEGGTSGGGGATRDF